MPTFEEIVRKANSGGAKAKPASTTTQKAKNTKSFEDIVKETNTRNKSTSANSVNGDFINSFARDVNQYFTASDKIYKNTNWGNATSAYKERQESARALASRANQIREWMDSNRYEISDDDYKSLSDMMDSYQKGTLDILNAFRKTSRVYSAFDSEEDYLNAVAQEKDRKEKSQYDLIAGQKEIDDLKAQLAELEQNKRYESLQQRINPAKPTEPTRQDIGYNPHTMWQQGAVETPGISEEEKLRQLIAQKQQYLNQAKRVQESNAYADTVNNEDFDQFDDYAESDDDQYNWINDAQFRDSYEARFQRNGTQSKYGFNHYDRMYDSEIAIYNYYYAKSGKEAAQKYLDNIQETLNAREAGEMYGQIEGNTAAELVFGISAGVNQFGTNVMNNFKFKADYIPQSAYQIASGMVREDLADNGKLPEWLGGGSLGQVAYDAITTTANMAPSILVGMATGGTAGTALMGLSAAGGAYQQALNEGFDKAQARGYSILVGVSEAVLEKVLGGISPVGGNAMGTNAVKNIANADNALKAIAKRIGGSLVSEFKEEYLQEVLDPLFRNLMMHTGEDVKLVSYEAIYSGILGALTGAFMEAPFAIYGETKTAITGRKIKEAGGVNDLAKIGNTFAPETVAYKLAGKVTNDTGAYTIGQLFNEVNARLTDQNISEIAEVLVENDVDERTARQYAEAFAYVVESGSMPDALANAIESDPLMAKAARKVLFEDNTTWNQRSQGYRDVLMKLAEDKVKGKTAPTSKASVPADNTAEEKTESGAEGNVETAKYGSIQNIKNGKVTVKMTDGTEVDLKDADLDPEDSVRIETIASIDGISAEDASGIFGILKAGSKNSQYDAIGAREAYRYGYYGLTEKMLDENGTFSKSLTPEQRKAVYEMGKKARDASVTAETGKIKQMREAANQKEPAKLRITYNQGNGVVQDIESKTITGLSRKQRAAVSFAKVLHQLGVGTDFEFFESYLSKTLKDKNGNRARVFLNDSGNEVIAYSGVYQTADGKIRIDLNAYSGRGLALNAMSHELVHFIKQWSPDRYRTMADIVGNAYGNTQMSMHQRVLREQARLKRIRGTEVSYDEAYDEVVANALNRMLDDGTVLDRIAEIRKVDGGLADKMIDCIRKFIKRFAKVFSDNESLFYDTEDLMQFKDTVEELRGMFAEALVEASDNRISSTETDTKTVEEKLQKDYAREQRSSQQTDRDRQQYNAFREKFAKERLDSLSDKLGRLFPLSAGFEQAIQKDQTPVSNMTVVANSLKKGNGESYYTAGKNAFRNVYGGRTTFSIKQLGISAEADDNFARESMSKVSDTKDLQTILDLTPYFKQLIEESRLLSVERTLHNDNKKTSLLCYRLYNAYVRKEDYIDANGSKQTHNVPHIVVFNVVQNLNDAKAHMVTDIKDVAVSNGHNSSKLKYATHANGNIYIDNIADVYDVVKSIDRKKGGLRYSAEDDLKYKFDYSHKNSGELYSTQETDNITARDLLSSTDASTIKNEVAKKKLADYQKILEVKNAEDQKLREIRAEIKELSFAKAPKDTKKLKDLKFEAIKINNHISVYEGQLQRMEKELQSVVKRERAKVVKEAEKRDKAVLAKEWMDAQVKQNETLREYRETRAALRQQESDTAVMEKEFIRITKEYEKQDAERVKTISDLRKELKNEAKKHRSDEKMWMAEFGRLMREYEAADRDIGKLERKIQRQKDSAEKSAMRRKISKVVNELDKILNKGNKKRNVKEDMKGVVSKALELADYLFTDHISNEDLIRKGITVRMTTEEAALVKETENILFQLYDNADNITDAEFNLLDSKRKRNLDKLRDLLAEQRNEYLNTPVYNLFNDLVTAYASTKDSEQAAVKAAYNPVVEGVLRSYIGDSADSSDSVRKTMLQNMRARDMTADELQRLYNAYTMVLHSIRNANKLFVKGKAESIDKMAEAITWDFGSHKIPDKKMAIIARNLSNKIGWDYEKLYYALDRIGSEAFTELVMNVANSENIVMRDVMEAAAFRDQMVEQYGFNNWDVNKEIDREFLDTTGKKFKLTLGQMMALYAYSRREGAWDHIEYGGFVFGDAALTNPRPADAYKLSKEQCEAITNLLTEEQKGYVKSMQRFLSETMGEKGNEVSMLMYGIKMFNEKNYFPIHMAGQFKAQANESQAKAAAGFQSMSNAGFTHAQNPNAKAPFVLEGFNEVWVDHVNEMSRYHGTVPALEDMRRVMNRSTYSNSTESSVSIKQLMENSFGKEAVEYFDDFYREANAGAITDKLQKRSQKLLSLFRKNSVAYSLSVLIQQPTSITRAYAMIDPRYFGYKGVGAITGGVVKTAANKWTNAQTKAYNEMLKYAPGVTMAKEIGGFDTATGGSIRSYLLDTNKSFKQKWKTGTALEKGKAVMDLVDDNAVANLPNLADKIAWIEIWNACKRESLAKHTNLRPSSDELLQIAGKRFTEVIRATQVYDSMFAKSPMLKSKNLFVQSLVSFMNEPNTVANMAESAMRDFVRGDKKSGVRKAAVLVNSIIATGVLKSIVYAMRDDDEDETYIEKYVEALTGSLMDDFNLLNYIPIARDVWSLTQGYDVERADMAIVADAIEALGRVIKNASTETGSMTEEQLIEFDKQCTEANWKMAESLATFLGIPMKNIRREIMGILNLARTSSANKGLTTKTSLSDSAYNAVIDSIPFLNGKKTKEEKLYEARMNSDEQYASRLASSYKDEKAANSAVTEAIKNRYKNGKLDEATALKHLVLYAGKDGTEAHWTMDKWKYQTQKGTDEGYSKYYKIYEAIKNGESITEAVEEHISNGSKENEVMSEVKSSIGEWYRKGEITKKEATDMLTDYFDLDSDEIEATIQKWSSKVDTGIAYDDIKTEYMDGNVTSAQAVDMYVKYGGYTKKEAEEEIAGYDFENEYGFSYSNRVTAYKEGIVSSSEMKSILMEHGNLKETDAEDTVKAYEFLKNHQQYDLDVNDAKKFTVRIGEKCEDRTLTDFGVSVESYLEYVKGAKNCKGVDADGDGHADRNTKAIQLFDMIDKLPISSTAKDGLAYITNAKGTINKYAPWHQ